MLKAAIEHPPINQDLLKLLRLPRLQMLLS
jgi:hypothetical protein